MLNHEQKRNLGDPWKPAETTKGEDIHLTEKFLAQHEPPIVVSMGPHTLTNGRQNNPACALRRALSIQIRSSGVCQ